MHDIIYKEFGKRLAEVRISRKLTQAEAAEKLGTVQSTYSGYELGTRKINLELILKFSEIYDVSPNFLITGEEDILQEIPKYLLRKCLISFLLTNSSFSSA